MSDVRVHIATALPDGHLERIRAVSPRLRVTYHPYIVQQAPVGMEALLGDVEVLLTYHADFELAAAPRLRWVQLAGDGVDYLLGRPIMASDVPITNARVFAAPIAEYAIASMVMFSRLIPKALFQNYLVPVAFRPDSEERVVATALRLLDELNAMQYGGTSLEQSGAPSTRMSS